MAKKSRDIEVFGLSFMDLISCGLGGVIVLMLIFSTLVKGGDSQNGADGRPETEEEAIKRQEQRSICHFYLEVDVISNGQENDGMLYFENQQGIYVDSTYKYLTEKGVYWKRYVVSYSLPKSQVTGIFPFEIRGAEEKKYETRVKLFTNKATEFKNEFTSNYQFFVKKIARNYTLKV